MRAVRDQAEQQAAALATDDPAEAAQLTVLGDYALAIQTALNLDGQQPFRYAGLAVDDALRDVEASLDALEKGGPCAAAGVPRNSPG